ncbi:hypothetical protein LAZ67_3001428 [Cordylochernes scorpioides]|uniref:Mos1 transposase HTH domain-containing protein n=1 Tax=Cordylochernes scorpioides TaxID=51811 RepID=A0ABY6K750_9ARAC|nr:hypothetical protein LAZ67_3001428 [Cordylochernes scorpioides]
MVISEPKSAHLREVLLFAFNWKKSATEAHRMLEEVHGDHALSKSQCYRWVPHELSERQQERRLTDPNHQKELGLESSYHLLYKPYNLNSTRSAQRSKLNCKTPLKVSTILQFCHLCPTVLRKLHRRQVATPLAMDATGMELIPKLIANLIAKPITKLIVIPITKPIAEPITNPIANLIAIYITKSIVKPITKPIAKRIAKPITKPIFKPITKPIAEPITNPIANLIAKPIV